MEETIVMYAPSVHLNTMSLLANFITKHNPSIPILVLSTAAPPTTFAAAPSITYRRLPAVELPPDVFPTLDILFDITLKNTAHLRDAIEEITQKSKVKAFIIDALCNPGYEVSRSLNIPTYFYISSGAFTLCRALYFPTIHDTVPGNLADLNDLIDVPGCPLTHSSDITKSLLIRDTNNYKLLMETLYNMQKCDGILVNSFDALEIRAKEALSNGLCIPNAPTPPVYFVGPLTAKISSSQNDGVKHECLRWLDSQPSKSVIFLCFGRWGLFSAQQLKEMAVGLENRGHGFLWVVRDPPELGEVEVGLDVLLPEGFLQRTKGRGFVVRKWAPQKEVLSHDSVGGFVTHCGRSSILEAVSFGVPMIACPMYAEQMTNRTYLVEEIKLALALKKDDDGFVTATELEERVRELMESKRGRDIRNRVGEMKIAAEAAVCEGGSSVVALRKFLSQ